MGRLAGKARLKKEFVDPQVLGQLRMECGQEDLPAADKNGILSIPAQDLHAGTHDGIDLRGPDEDAGEGIAPEG